jgi:hypothetical protein
MLAIVSSLARLSPKSTDQVRLVGSDALNGQDEEEEEDGKDGEALGGSSNYSVVPGEDGQLVQAGDEVPAGGRVSRDEDSERDNGECVHGVAPSRFQLGVRDKLCVEDLTAAQINGQCSAPLAAR